MYSLDRGGDRQQFLIARFRSVQGPRKYITDNFVSLMTPRYIYSTRFSYLQPNAIVAMESEPQTSILVRESHYDPSARLIRVARQFLACKGILSGICQVEEVECKRSWDMPASTLFIALLSELCVVSTDLSSWTILRSRTWRKGAEACSCLNPQLQRHVQCCRTWVVFDRKRSVRVNLSSKSARIWREITPQ